MNKKSIVSLRKIKGSDIKDEVKKTVDLLGGMGRFVTKGSKVLLKPNLVYPYPPPMVTSPELIEAVAILVFEAGAKEVWIGDSSSYTGKPLYGNNRWENKDVFEIHGINKIAKSTGAKVLNFDECDTVRVKIDSGIILKEVDIFKPVLDADIIINLPALKMHFQTLVTLGIKNYHGIITDYWKMQFHKDEISQKLVDLHKVINTRLTIIDGLIAMQGLGPRTGTDVKMDVIMASQDVVAIDAVASEVMGLRADEVETTRLAYHQGLGQGDIKNISVLGDRIKDVAKTLDRPDTRIEGIFPGINVLKGGVCVHCYGRARIFLDSLTNSGLYEKANIETVIIGVKPKMPELKDLKGNVLIVGDCANYEASHLRTQLKDRVFLMTGCPPVVSVHYVLDEINKRFGQS
jgi:uncharacterized protein (DUF362 family)